MSVIATMVRSELIDSANSGRLTLAELGLKLIVLLTSLGELNDPEVEIDKDRLSITSIAPESFSYRNGKMVVGETRVNVLHVSIVGQRFDFINGRANEFLPFNNFALVQLLRNALQA